MKNLGSWTIQDDGALLHRTCDSGVKAVGKRDVCAKCFQMVPKVVNQLADDLSQHPGEVNMTINELEEQNVEETEETLEEGITALDAEIEAEAAYQAGDLEEEEEAEEDEDYTHVFGNESLGQPVGDDEVEEDDEEPEVPEVLLTEDAEIEVVRGQVRNLIR